MSLHCAATLIVRRPARALAQIDALRDRRVAALYAEQRDDEQVQAVARHLGLDVLPLSVAGDSGWAFVHANESVLEGVSDLHRGETVLLLVASGDIDTGLDIEFGDDGVRIL